MDNATKKLSTLAMNIESAKVAGSLFITTVGKSIREDVLKAKGAEK